MVAKMADNAPRGRANERRRRDEGKAGMMKVSEGGNKGEGSRREKKRGAPLSDANQIRS